MPFAFLFAFLASGPQAEPIATFPVSVAVVTENGVPVADDAWIDAQLDFAETMFAGIGVRFGRTTTTYLQSQLAHLETRADRDSLASGLEPSVINVFVVASLRDVDDGTSPRMGVHWRERGHPDKHFLILAATARPTTLAHELGHFFGNGHSGVEDNLMSYTRTGGAVFFDEVQARRIRQLAKDYLRTKELKMASPTP